jgi:hypothetical protein
VTGRGHALLLAVFALLGAGAASVLVGTAAARHSEERSAREFQTLVRGVGFGPAVDLSACAFALDPRLAARCARDAGPIPAGSAYCPHHSLAIFRYPSLERADARVH